MNRARRWPVLVLLIGGAVAGCATTTMWTHPTKGAQEFYGEDSACIARAAVASAAARDPYAAGHDGGMGRRVYRGCMIGLGWRPEARQ
jgi:hypothetical protein